MRRITQSELLDTLDTSQFSPAELAENLADIARLNRLTGTTVRICSAALNLIPAAETSATILDVGTGAADVPLTLCTLAARRGFNLRMVVADRHPGVLSSIPKSIATMRADALWLPLATASVDIVICSQMLHHLTPVQVMAALREFSRVVRRGIVLFDVERSRLAVLAARLLTLAVSRNRLTRNDGPLSMRRSYRREEIRSFAVQAGLNMTAFQMNAVFPFRWIGIYRPCV